jgi:tetratricopeptide (TPR) repeat protein
MKYLISVIVIVTVQLNACSKKQESLQNTSETQTETRMIFHRDLVERADEMCKKEGDCERALILYTQALEQDKDNDPATIYGKRAMAYYALKNFDNAISDFTAAIERKPKESSDWYFMRGLTKSLLPIEDKAGACKDFKSAKKQGYMTSVPRETHNFNEWVAEYCNTKELIF